MARVLFSVLLVASLAVGYPYAALILNRVIGTNTVVFTEHDGQQRSLVMGPDAPRPAWLPLLPRSVVVQAGHWLPSPGREIGGDVEVLTHKSVADITGFYMEHLAAAGFRMTDKGYGPLNAATASMLAIENFLEGYRADLNLGISVTTRSAGGFILPSRIVQIHWQTRTVAADAASSGPAR